MHHFPKLFKLGLGLQSLVCAKVIHIFILLHFFLTFFYFFHLYLTKLLLLSFVLFQYSPFISYFYLLFLLWLISFQGSLKFTYFPSGEDRRADRHAVGRGAEN